MDRWYIIEYNKVCSDFLAECGTTARARIKSKLDFLQIKGNRVGNSRPLVGHNNLFELKIKTGEHEVRIFYCFFPGREICLLHACFKKKSKIPKDIEIAEENKKIVHASKERTSNVVIH